VSLTIADSILTIKVRDTGIGIAPDRMAALFDPFVQADRTITRKYGGTGLGLTICRELAELMGGEISVESVLGEGSVFTANVPVNRVTGSDVAIAPSRPVEAPELARSWNLKLLIADDNQVNQLILQTMLLPMGFELTTVDDGRAALDALKQDAFDIVLMDVQMPVMDGISAVREYREFEKEACRPPIPVIAVTANVMAHQVTEYEEAGMSGMVEKPIQFAALVAEIGRLLDGRS
jgi:CheY-like chemotaxis protein